MSQFAESGTEAVGRAMGAAGAGVTGPGDDRSAGVGRAAIGEWIRLFRPRQWVKNGFVLAPLLFSGLVSDAGRILTAFGAFGLFCLLASGVYCLNDVADRVADRSHPTKRNRPIARGAISPRAGVAAGTLLVVTAISGAWLVSPLLGGVMLGYIGLSLLYNRILKSLVILDVFAIAGFFLLRLLAGAAAVEVRPSVWLLICGGLLANYLGFTKRRHELAIMGEDSTSHRSVLEHYDIALLDQMSVILLSVTVVAYLMYTLTSQTAALVGETLSYSTVFVLYGMFRYLYLVHFSGKGGDPTETLLRDRALLVDVALWLAYCGWVIYRPF